MTMKIGLVFSFAVALGFASGCSPASTQAMSSHASFAGAPEYSGLALPDGARVKGDPRAEPSRLADAPVPFNSVQSAPFEKGSKDVARTHVL